MLAAAPQRDAAHQTGQHATQSRSDRSRSVIPFVLLVGMFAIGALVEASPGRATLFGFEGPVCPSTWLVGSTGCPGCGLTRGTALLLDGQLSAASKVNAAAWLVVILGGLGALLHGWTLASGVRFEWTDRWLRRGRLLFAAGLIATWLATATTR